MRKYLPFGIAAGVLVLILGIGAFSLTGGKGIGQFFFGKAYAEGELKDYVATVLQDEVRGVSCQALDTDDNGYVACDFTTAKQPGETKSLECAAWSFGGLLNRGCKTRFPGLR